MPELVPAPVRVPVPGGKLIDEYVGRASTGSEAVSVAHMRSPAGWEEPAQTPQFDEVTLVLGGTVRVEHDGGVLEVSGRPGRADPRGRAGPLHDARRRRVRRGLPAGLQPRHRPPRGVTAPPPRTVRRAPKVLLHDHLDGGLRPAHRRRAGRRDRLRRPARPPTPTSSAGGSATPPTPATWSVPVDVRPHRRRHADRARRWCGSPGSAPRTSPPTASSTPRCASRPSCTSSGGWRWTRSSRRCWRASRQGARPCDPRSARC